MNSKLLLICTFLFLFTVRAQNVTKIVSILHNSSPLVIDGFLDEKEWSSAPEARGFFQYHPISGAKPSQKTTVKLLYDNSSIYIGAIMYDTSPDSILTELGKRDSDDRINYDFFSVEIDPFNDAKTAYEFLISASGVQTDNLNTIDSWDPNWNSVWESAVQITDEGWIAELRIPFSELRYPTESIKNWGINFFRKIKRYEEFVTWNFVDKNIHGRINQAGELTGIKNLKPPVRLSLYPYFSTYYEHNGVTENDSYSVKGGMDLKYGINESLTLDMMLIPDFGQVKSDDQVLNLSSFETYYEEKRQFFTEGSTLFNRAGIFYSRRIGDVPENFYSVSGKLNENEKLISNPSSKKLLNATKLSGRFSNGWSLALLNAYSLKTYAEAENTKNGSKREILTSPASNSSVIVVEKSFDNNSYLSLINTNLYIPSNDAVSNVTGTEFAYSDKTQSNRIVGKAAISQIYQKETSPEFGWYYDLYFSKSLGNFKIEAQNRIYNEKYNPNAMGFLTHNNEIFNELKLNYNSNKSVWGLKSLNSLLRYRHYSLYSPTKFSDSEIYFNLNVTPQNDHFIFFDLSITPTEKYDYYEPRVWGKKYAEPRAVYVGGGYKTDAKKMYSGGLEAGFWTAEEHNKKAYWLTLLSKWRFTNYFSVNLELNYNKHYNTIGFVEKSFDDSEIFFGRRNADIFTNLLEVKYSLSTKLTFDLRVRHYLYTLFYKEFYLLGEDGHMKKTVQTLDNRDLSYNNFNSELSLTWNFTPGSELSLLWKNQLNHSNSDYYSNYFDKLNGALSKPKINNISLRMIYYLSYSDIFN